MQYVTRPEQETTRLHEPGPTARKLSLWLRSSGVLPRGSVTSAQVEQHLETSVSSLFFLTVDYSRNAPRGLPSHLVVKLPLSDSTNSTHANREIDLYARLAPLLQGPPFVRCLAAIREADGDPGCLVLEDLRATHDHPPWPLPPSRAQSELALDALARTHAHWWEAPTLGRSVGELHTEDSLRTMVDGISAHLPGFLDAIGDAVTDDDRRLLERVFASSLRPWLRLVDTRALTLTHGDAHVWNFLFPRSGGGAAFLIDWQLWHVDVGARDLAFLIALHWYPRRRQELERPLIRRYHDRLVAFGVGHYSFDDLWLDYRRAAVRNLTIPIIFWQRGMKPEAWWHRLECALSAFRDLECEELL